MLEVAYIACGSGITIYADKEQGPFMELDKEIDAIQAIVNDLEKLGFENIQSLTDFSFVVLKTIDDWERIVTINVTLDSEYGSKPLKFISDVPNFAVDATVASLPVLYDEFCEAVPLYSQFWSVCEAIDDKCWVLEPVPAKMTDTERRVVVDTCTTLKISIDPETPKSFPKIEILGPEESKEKIFKSVNERVDSWDEWDDFVSNLEYVLGVKFPESPSDAMESSSNDPCCSICLVSELEGTYPEIVCDAENCNQIYHKMCFIEYIEALPNALRTRYVISGECPNCCHNITFRRE
ncbi:E3 ubiquitin-protein ligase FANCL-like isoform X1 [Artemia franciscana]|uniref:E3 ubiquitin-protein ligase FANCL n=1 Tax=Artemia franciscana TaxID=6661 RepID=A0AA88H3G3_ARTSF|nr:hypothetical protein QYM36_017780 [Artemia franciscana]